MSGFIKPSIARQLMFEIVLCICNYILSQVEHNEDSLLCQFISCTSKTGNIFGNLKTGQRWEELQFCTYSFLSLTAVL
jgi:hypothetical protein